MHIAAITVYTADLPLAEPFRHASSGLIDCLREVVVRIEDGDGVAGWSEVRGNAPYVTGETQGRVVAALCELLAPRLVASGEVHPSAIGRVLDAMLPGNTTAKAAIDIAVYDAAARALGVPLRTLLGGGGASVPIHGTLPFCPPVDVRSRVDAYLDMGVHTIKLRLGLPAIEDDLARLRALREALAAHPLGAGAKIAADVNQGWSAKQALRNLPRLEADAGDYPLAWLEQPVPAPDLAGLRMLREAAAVPIFADESCCTPQDLLRLAEAPAVDGVHLKLCKAGGIGRLMALVAIAEAAGLPYLMGQMDEGMLATAAALHCAAAAAPLSCELWGFQRVGAQPFSGIAMRGGAMHLPAAAGLGVEVDEAALTRVARFETAAP